MLAILLASCLHASPNEATFDFRGLGWGTSPELALQKMPLLVPGDRNENQRLADYWGVDELSSLVGADKVDGTPGQLTLTFHRGRLVSVALVFSPPTDRSNFVADFRRKLSLLEKKYGAPDMKMVQCLSVKLRTMNEANCLTTPNLNLVAGWDGPKNNRTKIVILAQDAADKAEFAIRYFDMVAARSWNDAKTQSALKDL